MRARRGWWVRACQAGIILTVVGCRKERPTPAPSVADGTPADTTTVGLTCHDKTLVWSEADSVVYRKSPSEIFKLVPEARAHLLQPDAFRNGRAILKLVVVRGLVSFSTDTSLIGRDSACVIVSGSYPQNLRARIVRYSNDALLASVPTDVRIVTRPHEKPEADWVQDVEGLESAGMLPNAFQVVLKQMQGGCTRLGCCKARQPV